MSSIALAEMQMVVASIYHRYNTRVSAKTTDASMEILDQIGSAGPIVGPIFEGANSRVGHAILNLPRRKSPEVPQGKHYR